MAISSKNNSHIFSFNSVPAESLIGIRSHKIKVCRNDNELKRETSDLSEGSLLMVDGTMYVNPYNGDIFILSN
jgi:hypothetical protein